jgi:predicted NAD/FAD-binding protein
MRVAVIGTGIAGLTAAWLLRRKYAVTLYEAEDRPGGHTHTHRVEIDGQAVDVDTGFIVYNDRNYPTFTRLLHELRVTGMPTEMSFSVRHDASGMEYNGGSARGLLARPRNLIDPHFLRMVLDILRFNRQAPRLLALHGPGPSLRDYLRDARFGAAFAERYLLPMSAAIWSVPTRQIDQTPAKRIVEFFRHHGLLSLDDRPQWYVVRGGSRRYVDALLKDLPDPPRLGEPVLSLRRAVNHVTLRTAAGYSEFDAVVLACHSDQALRLLEDPSPAEQAVLGAIRYQDNEVVLHTDASVMPRASTAWASWNYRLGPHSADTATVTYWMNHLQHLETPRPLLVTLNQTSDIDPTQVLRRMQYSHPVFDGPALAAQARRREISGVRHTWYCGAWWRYGFHEDGCRSAVDVATGMGIEW